MPNILLAEALIALIQTLARLAQVAGKTKEEVNTMFNSEWVKLKARDPDNLSDPTTG